ncbi:unnamed protein product [Hymenolepis diminuta]|uniref:DUF5727 domain-containing protein n=1 Tax=Hymenolepis diminuta TaxID=6216 RepID=A0A564Z5X8_HYMDI|nr:unnamed protein product [Hymenolepis diminuta]
MLTSAIETYTVYFAKDCKFSSPKDGEVIVEKSIPLYRYLRGKTEENVAFAMKGTNYSGNILFRDNLILCEWKDLIPETRECANLIVDKANNLTIFNATFSKMAGKNYETLFFWGRDYNLISVNLDWTNSGEAPEVKACGKSDD